MTFPTGSQLSDCINWVRRIIKSPSTSSITDATIIDYINRFYLYDVPQRVQLFELKRQLTFVTDPYISQYNLPLNPFFGDVTVDPPEDPQQGYYFIREPLYIDGVQSPLLISNNQFYMAYPVLSQNVQPINGDGSAGPYDYTQPQVPILRGHRDILGILQPNVIITATSNSGEILYIVDDGLGNLIETDSSFQIRESPASFSGSVNYVTGVFEDITFSQVIPSGNPITFNTVPQQAGRPIAMLFFDNIMRLYPQPDQAYKVQVDAWVTPAQFLESSTAMPFAYMTEYLARGAARKIMVDNRDMGQIQFYEPFFRESEMNVLRRSNQQREQQRTPTIFSGPFVNNSFIYNRF